MSGKGGARPGAGRPAGSMTKRNRDIAEAAMQSGQTPLEYLLGIMRDEKADSRDRQRAAETSAPYLHPRISSLERTVTLGLPDTATLEGISTAIDLVLQSVGQGEIAPSEGRSVIAVIEAKRKAIETGELVERVKQIEDALEK